MKNASRTKPRSRRQMISGLAIVALGIAVVWKTLPESTRPESPVASVRENPRVARARHALGALSRRIPPSIARPDVGEALEREDLAPIFETYRAALCREYGAQISRHSDPDVALELARNGAVQERRAMLSLATDGVARTAGTSMIRYVAELAMAGHDGPCAVSAFLDVLRLWPEAEPASYLADLARDPPGGSLLVTCAAIDAMGQTGRADYAVVLSTFVRVGVDSRIVFNAVEASTTILGDSDVALSLLADDFVFDEVLAGGLPHALAVATGPSVDEVVQRLASSNDPNRRLTAFRAAAIGAGMPAALPAIVDAARRPSTTREEASRMVEAIQEVGADAAPEELMTLARDPRTSPITRAIALLAAGGSQQNVDLSRQIAATTTDPDVAIDLALSVLPSSSDQARRVLGAFARDPELETVLVARLQGARDGALAELANEYLDRISAGREPLTEGREL